MIELPEPECRLGYPRRQLADLLGARLDEFWPWMEGRTGAVCDGMSYDYEKREYRPTGCGPHGLIVYPVDVDRFLNKPLPVDR